MRTRPTTLRKPVLMAIALIFCWLGIVGSAWGQTPREDVRTRLDRTNQLIERARDVVARVGGSRAPLMLETAERIHRQAWEAFHAGRLRRADRMTEAARKNLLDLLSTFRQNDENASEVERQLERTDHALQDLRDQLGPITDPPRARRLDAAADMQLRAWDLFRQQHLRPALKMTLQVREMAQNLAGGGPGQGLGHGSMGSDDIGLAFEPRYERLHGAAMRVGEQVDAGNDDAAHETWLRAQQALDDARAAHEAGDDRRADQMLRLGRNLLERTMRQVQREVRGDQVEVLITSAKERLENLVSPVQDSGEKRLKDWQDQARQDLENAREALANGRLKESLVQTRKAVALLDKIADELGL